MSEDFKQRFNGRLGAIDRDGNLTLSNPINNKLTAQMSGKAIIQNNNQFQGNNAMGHSSYGQQPFQNQKEQQNVYQSNPFIQVNAYQPYQQPMQSNSQYQLSQLNKEQSYSSISIQQQMTTTPSNEYAGQSNNAYLQQNKYQLVQPYASPSPYSQKPQASNQFMQIQNPQNYQASQQTDKFGFNQQNQNISQQQQRPPSNNPTIQQIQQNIYQPYQQIPQEFQQLVNQMQQMMMLQQQQIAMLTKKQLEENQAVEQKAGEPLKNSNARKPIQAKQPVVVMNSDKLQPILTKKEKTEGEQQRNGTKIQTKGNLNISKQSLEIDQKSNVTQYQDLNESVHAKSTNDPQQYKEDIQLYNSRKPRQVQYKPYSLKEYQNNNQGYQKLGGLGAYNIGTQE